MPVKTVDTYEIEFTGELLAGTEQWGAYVAISAPSDNPMHLNVIHPKHRVAADHKFLDQHSAEAEAEQAAAAILNDLRS